MLIFQASVGDTYPTMNVSVIVFFQFLFSMVQCGAYAFFAVKDLSEWKLKADIGLIGILYQVHYFIWQLQNENQPQLKMRLYLCFFYFNLYTWSIDVKKYGWSDKYF